MEFWNIVDIARTESIHVLSVFGIFSSWLGLSIGSSSFCHLFSALVIDEVVLGCAWKLGMNRAKTSCIPTLPRDQ